MHAVKVPLFEIPNLRKGVFLTRPNRFVSEIKYNQQVKSAHIHDPGRLTELLVKGREVLFTDSRGKLDYYVKAVKNGDDWIIIDTAIHSKIALRVFPYISEIAQASEIRKEVKIGKSRIDFVLDGVPLEVKGVTLVKEDLALFPDAPTERGTRHVQEIIDNNGMLLFLVFRKATKFKPNFETDPKFYNKLSEARKKNIKIFVVQLSFDGKTIYYNGIIPLADF
ncbi:MAG: DNA/RNA nuclease SfsA [Candidatus Lokiarchaeota archaeon]|nr:DNA/RNA nuclease SfsA [Candidatus Lokiarchaeota archaeon]